MSENFFDMNRKWANCVGIFEEPLWPLFNPNQIIAWDQRPTANGNLAGITEVNSIKLK